MFLPSNTRTHPGHCSLISQAMTCVAYAAILRGMRCGWATGKFTVVVVFGSPLRYPGSRNAYVMHLVQRVDTYYRKTMINLWGEWCIFSSGPCDCRG